MNQDQEVDSKTFMTKPEGDKWVKEQKKRYGGSGDVLRHSVTEVLNDPYAKWEYSLFIRGRSK